MTLEVEQTPRGFSIIKFKDRYKFDCILQKSSLATEDCIWFGIKNDGPMHLTQDMVLDLLPYLHKFVQTGELE